MKNGKPFSEADLVNFGMGHKQGWKFEMKVLYMLIQNQHLDINKDWSDYVQKFQAMSVNQGHVQLEKLINLKNVEMFAINVA